VSAGEVEKRAKKRGGYGAARFKGDGGGQGYEKSNNSCVSNAGQGKRRRNVDKMFVRALWKLEKRLSRGLQPRRVTTKPSF